MSDAYQCIRNTIALVRGVNILSYDKYSITIILKKKLILQYIFIFEYLFMISGPNETSDDNFSASLLKDATLPTRTYQITVSVRDIRRVPVVEVDA